MARPDGSFAAHVRPEPLVDPRQRLTELLAPRKRLDTGETIQQVVDVFASQVDDPAMLELLVAVVDRIFSEKGAYEKKLILYCIDSIGKHLGPLFCRGFETKLESYVREVWDSLNTSSGQPIERDRRTLQKVFGYWSRLELFSPNTIQMIDSISHFSQQPPDAFNDKDFIHFRQYSEPAKICHLNVYINRLNKDASRNTGLYETIAELITGRDKCQDVVDFLVEKIRISKTDRFFSIFCIFNAMLMRPDASALCGTVRDRLLSNLGAFYEKIRNHRRVCQDFQNLIYSWEQFYGSEDIVRFLVSVNAVPFPQSLLKEVSQPPLPQTYRPTPHSMPSRAVPPPAFYPYDPPVAVVPPAAPLILVAPVATPPSYYPPYLAASNVVRQQQQAPAPPSQKSTKRLISLESQAEVLYQMLKTSINYIPNDFLFIPRPLYRIPRILEALKTGSAMPDRVYELSMDQSFRLNQQDRSFRNQRVIDILYKRNNRDSMKCDTCGLRFDTETEYQEVHIPYHFHLRQMDKAHLVRNFYSSSDNFDRLIFCSMLDSDVQAKEAAEDQSDDDLNPEASHLIPMAAISETLPRCPSCDGDFQSEWFNGAFYYKACKLVNGRLYHIDCDVSGVLFSTPTPLQEENDDAGEDVSNLLQPTRTVVSQSDNGGPVVKKQRLD